MTWELPDANAYLTLAFIQNVLAHPHDSYNRLLRMICINGSR